VIPTAGNILVQRIAAGPAAERGQVRPMPHMHDALSVGAGFGVEAVAAVEDAVVPVGFAVAVRADLEGLCRGRAGRSALGEAPR